MKSGLTVNVLCTCHGCGLQRVIVEVPVRGEHEDISAWIKIVQERVGRRHSYLSPNCREGKCDLAIPLPEQDNERIGGRATKRLDAAVLAGLNILKRKGAN